MQAWKQVQPRGSALASGGRRRDPWGMAQKLVIDIVVAVVGALVTAFGPPKAERLGGYMFLAGTLAALLGQR